MHTIAKAALKAVAVEEREAQLRVLLLAVMWRIGDTFSLFLLINILNYKHIKIFHGNNERRKSIRLSLAP